MWLARGRVGWSRPQQSRPPQAGPARCAVTSRRLDQLGRGSGRGMSGWTRPAWTGLSTCEEKRENRQGQKDRRFPTEDMAGVAGTGLKIEGSSEEQQERRWYKLGQVKEAINKMQIFEQHYISSCVLMKCKNNAKMDAPLADCGSGLPYRTSARDARIHVSVA